MRVISVRGRVCIFCYSPTTTASFAETYLLIMAVITRAVGQSGRRYLVERILQEKSQPDGCVDLASYVGFPGCAEYIPVW